MLDFISLHLSFLLENQIFYLYKQIRVFHYYQPETFFREKGSFNYILSGKA